METIISFARSEERDIGVKLTRLFCFPCPTQLQVSKYALFSLSMTKPQDTAAPITAVLKRHTHFTRDETRCETPLPLHHFQSLLSDLLVKQNPAEHRQRSRYGHSLHRCPYYLIHRDLRAKGPTINSLRSRGSYSREHGAWFERRCKHGARYLRVEILQCYNFKNERPTCNHTRRTRCIIKNGDGC